MTTRLTILLMLLLTPTSAFAGDGLLGQQDVGPTTTGNQAPTLEGCFRFPDPGMRSGCLMEVSATEKDVSLCDLIEIPGMVHDCIDGVAAVTTFTPNQCKIMNERYRDHCLRAAKH